ncbi:MAG: glycosyltransferase family 9 protein [Bryobacteraceae bacterium]
MKRLLIRTGAIGDCILAFPAMECLRAEETEVWVPSAVVPLVRFADRVRSIASTGLNLFGLPGRTPDPALVEALSRFDSIVSWYGENREEFRDAVRMFGWPVQFLRALPEETEPGHVTDYFLRQTGCPEGAAPRIVCPSSGGDLIVLHPFSGSAKKNWPLERFRAVAQGLKNPVAWCAGPEDSLRGAVRMEDLYELGCWLATARLFIGNDSGITHLAAAVGAPVVALFGPTEPARWAPRGPRVRIVKADMMERIEMEEVLHAIDDLL